MGVFLSFGMAYRLFTNIARTSTRSSGFAGRATWSPFYNVTRSMAEVRFVINDFGGAESVTSGELGKWNFQVGDYVEVDEEVCAIETQKIAVNPRSEHDGVITKLLKEPGDAVNMGDELWVLDTEGKPKEEKKEEPKQEAAKKESSKPSSESQSQKKQSKSEPKKSSAPPKEARSAPGGETRVKMSQMRQRIASRLKESQNTAAMLTTFQECDMHNLMEMRSQYKDDFAKEHGVKLGFMSCFVKAASNALLKERSVNAYIDGEEIVYKDYVDINVAVATPTGLLTPVLRDCDKMSFADVEKEINELAEKARNGRMTIPDLEAGTFTISNGGVYGSMMGTPIINPPQSAILGMHAITKRAVVINDQVVIRPMMYLALTYDHRLLDGKTAVTFLRSIKESVEDPRRLLLDL